MYAVIAYCPITDFCGADMAYEWTYSDTRETLYSLGAMDYTAAIELCGEETVMYNSRILKEAYSEYLVSLGLTDESGNAVTADNLKEHIVALMNKEIQTTIDEIGIEQMQADIEAYANDNNITWLTFNDDGTYTYDYDAHLVWLASHTELKIACVFSNYGTGWNSEMNEDNIFGGTDDEYCPFEFLSWELDAIDNNVGYDDTGLTWEEFLETEKGQEISLQLRMTSALEYLIDAQGADAAPYWYVRYGMADLHFQSKRIRL